jgi:hypothetical protein
MNVNWLNGSGAKRCVFIKLGTSGSAVPLDGTTYTPNTLFGSGTQIGTSGWYCVYNGSPGMAAGITNVTGLTENTQYIVMVCDYFGNPGSEEYMIQSATLNPNTNQTPMPVEMMNFTFNTSGKNVLLKWSTMSEMNNSGFELERAEFRSEILVFRKAGYVTGKGTTNTPTEYSFTDNGLNTGKYRYRLKQIDYNGNFEYHALNQVVEIDVPNKFALRQNYPNPFNPTTKICFDLPQDENVYLSVYDLKGSKVRDILKERKQAGYYELSFDGSSLSSGIYIITLKSGNFNSTKRMILLK